MATRTKEGSGHGKEKSSISPSTPQNIDAPHGRRSFKSSVSGSLGKDNSILSEKPVPHYLKPTVSSTHETHKYLKKQTSEGSTTRRLTTRRSFDKPPSASQTQKVPLSAGSKERTLKSSSPSPRPASSTKPILTKTVKTVGIGKGKSVKKETGGVKKRETKVTPPTSSHERGKKETVHNVPPEESKVQDEEHGQVEILPVEDQIPADSEDTEPNISLEAGDTCMSLDEHEVNCTTEEANDNFEVEVEGNHEYKEEESEEGAQDGESPQHNIESLVPKDHGVVDGEQGEEGINERPEIEIKAVVAESGDEYDKEIHNADNEGAKGMEGDSGDRLEDTQPKKENVTPKRPDVLGKKDAPAAYNDVIEETATKLVEQRKSKVKALAGAFETVISLQNQEGSGN